MLPMNAVPGPDSPARPAPAPLPEGDRIVVVWTPVATDERESPPWTPSLLKKRGGSVFGSPP
jgi:hypothetical protein